MKSSLCRIHRTRLSPMGMAGVTLFLAGLGLLLGLPSEWFLLAVFPVIFLTDKKAECRWFKRGS